MKWLCYLRQILAPMPSCHNYDMQGCKVLYILISHAFTRGACDLWEC